MSRGDVDVYPENGSWHLGIVGVRTALQSYDSREEAVANGRREADVRRVGLIVRDR